MRRLLPALTLATGAGIGLWWWWRLHPTSRPFAQRLWVDCPQPFITQRRLRAALDPQPGEHLLEVGVGSGRYAVEIAGHLGPAGAMTAVDLHADMLELTHRRVRRRRAPPVALVRANAAALPFPEASFDGAYMASALGQVPDPTAGLAELRRVVRPGGRVVVGDVAYDPHGLFFPGLRRRALSAGLSGAGRWGGPAGYFARFTVPG
ncbi:MAG: class I SAM-dependent methyltransferase [Marmoricola sp.]